MPLPTEDRELLRSLIHDHFELGPVVVEDATRLMELYGIDSMKLLRLVAAVERSFSIDLGFESLPRIHTFLDFERLVAEAQVTKAARVRAFGV